MLLKLAAEQYYLVLTIFGNYLFLLILLLSISTKFNVYWNNICHNTFYWQDHCQQIYISLAQFA